MRALIVYLSILLTATVAYGQQQAPIPDDVIQKLANDLARLHQAALQAQSQVQWSIPVPAEVEVTSETPVKAGAHPSAKALLVARPGQRYAVVDKAGDWYAIQAGPNTYGWVSAANVVPVAKSGGTMLQSTPTPYIEQIYQTLTDGAVRLRDVYKGNPYVIVTGFSLQVGWSPSVEITFVFK
jgi:hypothetical protein